MTNHDDDLISDYVLAISHGDPSPPQLPTRLMPRAQHDLRLIEALREHEQHQNAAASIAERLGFNQPATTWLLPAETERLRKSRGMQFSDLGKALGSAGINITPSALRGWLLSKQPVRVDREVVIALAAILGASATALVAATGHEVQERMLNSSRFRQYVSDVAARTGRLVDDLIATVEGGMVGVAYRNETNELSEDDLFDIARSILDRET